MTNPSLTPLEELRKKLEGTKECWIENLSKWPQSETFLYDPRRIGHNEVEIEHFISKSALDEALLEIEKRDAEIAELKAKVELSRENSIATAFHHEANLGNYSNEIKRKEELLKKQSKLLDEALLEIEKRDKLIDEARKVIEFYGDLESWEHISPGRSTYTVILDDLGDGDYDNGNGTDDMSVGGLKARAFLAKLDGGK